MKNILRKTFCFLFVCIIIVSFGSVLSHGATGTLTLKSNKSSVLINDSFTVTLEYSGSTIVAYADWKIEYDASMVSCGSYNGVITDYFDPGQYDNAKTFTKTYSFVAKKAGNISINISGNVYNLNPNDGDKVELSKKGVSVSISTLPLPTKSPEPTKKPVITAKPTAVPTAKPTEKPTSKPTGKPTNKPAATPTATPKKTPGPSFIPSPTIAATATPSPLLVTVNGTGFEITDKPENVTLPDDFKEITFTFENEDVWAAVNSASNVVIMYLNNNENAGFYVYDELLNEFYEFISCMNFNNTYTVVSVPAGATIPNGFNEKKMSFDDTEIVVWVPADKVNESADEINLMLIYAINKEGRAGFYLYDKEEETIIRYVDDLTSSLGAVTGGDAVNTPEPSHKPTIPGVVDEDVFVNQIKNVFVRIYSGEGTMMDWTMFVLLLLVVILLILLVIFIVYAVQKRKEDNDTEDYVAFDNPVEEDLTEDSENNLNINKNSDEEIVDDEFNSEGSEISEAVEETICEEAETSEEVIEEQAAVVEDIPETILNEKKDKVENVISEEDKKKDELFDFTFDNFEETKSTWNFDDEIDEDFFNEN